MFGQDSSRGPSLPRPDALRGGVQDHVRLLEMVVAKKSARRGVCRRICAGGIFVARVAVRNVEVTGQKVATR